MHPLVNDLSELKDSELESKINDLTRKYFMTQSLELRMQISIMLDTYKETLSLRRQEEYARIQAERNKDLDNLIKVN